MDAATAASNDSAPPPSPGVPEVIEVRAPDKLPHHDALGATPAVDRFAREAAQQYAEGHIDQPLWDRAVAHSNGDSDAAVAAYLKARATALRLLDRELRQEHRAQARASTPRPHADAAPDQLAANGDEEEDTHAVHSADFARKRMLGKYRTALIGGGIAVPIVLVGAWFLFGRSDVPPAAPAAKPAAVAAAKPAAPAAAKVQAAAETRPVNAEFMQKLQQFRDAGNWNMVVLYAVEWTRRDPANAAAWNELRAGYVNLRQYDDALTAARKAVDLAPGDAALWRHLGNAELDVDDPAKALAAFTEAAARDRADVYSLQQIGLLNARAGRMPEAKSAFDLALGAQPGDALTQCLKGGVAQLAVQKDPHAAALQVRNVDGKCRGTDVASESPPAVVATQRPGAPSGMKRGTAPRS
ncbi:MAG: hypothetical protein U1F48_06805 [Burkholderiales bacterium]